MGRAGQWLARAAKRGAAQIGRRGASLLFLGLLAFVLAASLLFAPPELKNSPNYQMLIRIAPLEVWAGSWTASGILCWIQAFARQDRIAFAFATAMWWTYGIATFIGVITGINPRGWVGGLIWMAFGGWINLIATWPETPRGEEAHARPK